MTCVTPYTKAQESKTPSWVPDGRGMLMRMNPETGMVDCHKGSFRNGVITKGMVIYGPKHPKYQFYRGPFTRTKKGSVLRHGKGFMLFKDGEFYDGYFDKGMPSGIGRFYREDTGTGQLCNTYTVIGGFFTNGVLNGPGVYCRGSYWQSDHIAVAMFENNKAVSTDMRTIGNALRDMQCDYRMNRLSVMLYLAYNAVKDGMSADEHESQDS